MDLHPSLTEAARPSVTIVLIVDQNLPSVQVVYREYCRRETVPMRMLSAGVIACLIDLFDCSVGRYPHWQID